MLCFITDIRVYKRFLIFYRFRTYDWIFAYNSETIGILVNDLRRFHDVHVGDIDGTCASVRCHRRQIPDKKKVIFSVHTRPRSGFDVVLVRPESTFGRGHNRNKMRRTNNNNDHFKQE